MSAIHLRPYRVEDEAASIDLWHRTWQQAYPQIDFAARLDWWRERWRKDLVPKASIVVSEQDGALTGFVTIDGEGYLDQLVVDPAHWGSTRQGCWWTRPSGCRRQASRCSSTRTIPAPSASTSATASPMPATT